MNKTERAGDEGTWKDAHIPRAGKCARSFVHVEHVVLGLHDCFLAFSHFVRSTIDLQVWHKQAHPATAHTLCRPNHILA